MSLFRYTAVFILFLALFSCKKESERTVIAEVYGKKLYLDEITDIIPDDASKEDSLTILGNKINLWVRKQTLLNRAELNLSEEQKDIDKIVEEYRESLLIEKYKQEYIKQYLDTGITDAEAENYYANYPESFILNSDIVKAYFFKFKSKTNIDDFKKYFLSENKEDILNMKKAAEEKAEDFIDFTDKWTDISVISNLLPVSVSNIEAAINQSNRIQMRDNEFVYFVYFTDYRLKGEKMPFEIAKEKIKIILLNKRKIKLINNLEEKIYESALKNGRIKIYTE